MVLVTVCKISITSPTRRFLHPSINLSACLSISPLRSRAHPFNQSCLAHSSTYSSIPLFTIPLFRPFPNPNLLLIHLPTHSPLPLYIHPSTNRLTYSFTFPPINVSVHHTHRYVRLSTNPSNPPHPSTCPATHPSHAKSIHLHPPTHLPSNSPIHPTFIRLRGGRNSSVGRTWARCPRCRGFDPPLGTFSGTGDFSLGVIMGSNSIPPKTPSDESINRGLVCVHMHFIARTQKILTFMS